MRFLAILILSTIACAAAQAEGNQCQGGGLDWQLEYGEAQARFRFPALTEMDVMLVSRPERRDWPQAFTLIGERDITIVLLENEPCEDLPFRAHVMTERGQTPILPTGCRKASP